jgi:hypothetical protein
MSHVLRSFLGLSQFDFILADEAQATVRTIAASSNELHSCGFLDCLLAQLFYGWVKQRCEFLRGLQPPSRGWL